jgi:hypothetical protein
MELKPQSRLISDTKHRNSLFEVIVLFVAALLLLLFVVRPKYNMVQVKADELKTAQSQQQAIESDRKTMNDLIDKLDNSQADLALVDQALPLQGRVTSLDLLLDNLVLTSGMKLASINTDEGTSGIVAGDKKLLADPYGSDRKLQTILANVTVTGPIEQFRQLLKLIETNSRLMDIDTISISKQDEIIYKIRLKAYFYAPEYAKVAPQ